LHSRVPGFALVLRVDLLSVFFHRFSPYTRIHREKKDWECTEESRGVMYSVRKDVFRRLRRIFNSRA
jgi:hypothetical protein